MSFSIKKVSLFFISFVLFIPFSFSQVPNDDCANAIDYGFLDGDLSDYDWAGIANHDTCFTLSTQNAIPNFPFYYTYNFCGPSSNLQVDDVLNDVWFKVETYGTIKMLVYSNTPSDADTMKITFWRDEGGGCGDFPIGGISDIIPIGDNNSFYDVFDIPISGTWYAQISSTDPTNDLDISMCLSYGGITSGVYCTMTESSYDSLCFMTTVDSINPTNGNNNGSIMVDASFGTAPYSFLWGDNSTSNMLENLSEGNYAVTISDATNCSETVEFSLEASTSIDEIPNENIDIFPNPARHSFHVNLPIHTTIKIHDINGKLCKEIIYNGENIDVSKLSTGLYFVRFINEAKGINMSKKIIIN